MSNSYLQRHVLVVDPSPGESGPVNILYKLCKDEHSKLIPP